jgi:asparagine synthase (glutamine-hydrolysing)
VCGIAGELGPAGLVSAHRVLAMVDGMAHRGPDGKGVYATGGLAIGACRLAIRGREFLPVPTVLDDCSQVLAFNGEIYRPVPAASSDSDWLLRRLERLGRGGFDDLDGMFAIALADPAGQQLWLGRDAFGIKPLFVQRTGQIVRFASELEPLWWSERAEPAMDAEAFAEYVGLGRRLGEETPFKDTVSLEPGVCIMIRSGDEPSWRGTPIRTASQSGVTPTDHPAGSVDALAEALERSILRCATSNRPLGLFVSGGLDSTVIAAVLAKHGVEDLQTFSLLLGEDGVKDLTGLALPGTSWRSWRHHVLRPTMVDLDRAFEEVLSFTSEPTFPTSAACTLLLADMAAAAGVKVALSGEGADEVFGGYRSYVRFLTSRPHAPAEAFYLRDSCWERTLFLLGGSSLKIHQRVRRRLQELAAGRGLAGVLRLERLLSLRPLLDRLDQTTMRRSIEARVPYLHGGLPPLAMNAIERDPSLPDTKPVLRAAALSFVGQTRIRVPKRPLRIPPEDWLTGPRLKRVTTTLLSADIPELFPIDPTRLAGFCEELLQGPSTETAHVAVRIYQLARFWRRFGSRDRSNAAAFSGSALTHAAQ